MDSYVCSPAKTGVADTKQTETIPEHNMSTKSLIAGAAVAGLLSGAFATQANAKSAANPGTSIQKMAGETHDCKGQNSCKGKGGCKSGDKGCAGKNTCKGKGGCAMKDGKPVHK